MKVIDSRPCTYRDCGQQLVERDGHRAIPHWHADDAHSATADCHTYTPKEEPMPKSPTVFSGRVVSLLGELDLDTGAHDAEVTVRLEDVDHGSEFTLGAEVVLLTDPSRARRAIGPSPEEQAVIDAAIKFIDLRERSMRVVGGLAGAINASKRLESAVKAMKGGK